MAQNENPMNGRIHSLANKIFEMDREIESLKYILTHHFADLLIQFEEMKVRVADLQHRVTLYERRFSGSGNESILSFCNDEKDGISPSNESDGTKPPEGSSFHSDNQ